MTSTSIPYFIIGLALASLVWITFGPIIDGFNEANEELATDTDLSYSSERLDAWNFGRMIFENLLIIVVIGFVIAMFIEVIAEHSGWGW